MNKIDTFIIVVDILCVTENKKKNNITQKNSLIAPSILFEDNNWYISLLNFSNNNFCNLRL